jgi:hypothetical protein
MYTAWYNYYVFLSYRPHTPVTVCEFQVNAIQAGYLLLISHGSYVCMEEKMHIKVWLENQKRRNPPVSWRIQKKS